MSAIMRRPSNLFLLFLCWHLALLLQVLAQGPPPSPSELSLIFSPSPATMGQPFVLNFNRVFFSSSDPTTFVVAVSFTSSDSNNSAVDAPQSEFSVNIPLQQSGTISQDVEGQPLYKLDQFTVGPGYYNVKVWDTSNSNNVILAGQLDLEIDAASSTSSKSSSTTNTSTSKQTTSNQGTPNTGSLPSSSGSPTSGSDSSSSGATTAAGIGTISTGSTSTPSGTSAGSTSTPSGTSAGASDGPQTSPTDGSSPGSPTSSSAAEPGSPTPGSAADPGNAKRHVSAGAIAGGVVGGVCFLLFLIGICAIQRRARSRERENLARESERINPYNVSLPSAAVPTGKPKFAPSSDDMGLHTPLEKSLDGQISGMSTPGDRLNNDAAATPSPALQLRRNNTTATASERQAQLQERQERNLQQLASLESRMNAVAETNAMMPAEGAPLDMVMVAREEHEATRAEMSRLREENMWLREAQQSDWAFGLSDEMPLPYQGRLEDT